MSRRERRRIRAARRRATRRLGAVAASLGGMCARGPGRRRPV